MISDSRSPETGSVTFKADDDATRDYLKALATPAQPLLLQAAAGHHEPDRWVLLGDEELTRLVDAGEFAYRDAAYSFTVVKRPAGAIENW